MSAKFCRKSVRYHVGPVIQEETLSGKFLLLFSAPLFNSSPLGALGESTYWNSPICGLLACCRGEECRTRRTGVLKAVHLSYRDSGLSPTNRSFSTGILRTFFTAEKVIKNNERQGNDGTGHDL